VDAIWNPKGLDLCNPRVSLIRTLQSGHCPTTNETEDSTFRRELRCENGVSFTSIVSESYVGVVCMDAVTIIGVCLDFKRFTVQDGWS
jgi:hypothetical protein